jgi:hypothetical protein
VLLVLIGSVTDLAEAMQEHGTRQAVAGLALVELLPSRAAQFGIVDPVERYVEYGLQEKTPTYEGVCVSKSDRTSEGLSRCSGWSKGGCSPCWFRRRRTGGPARGSAPAAQKARRL